MQWSTCKLVYKITNKTFYIHTEGKFLVDFRHRIKIILAKMHIRFAEKFNYEGDIIFSRYLCRKCFHPVKGVFSKKEEGYFPMKCPKCGEAISRIDIENSLNGVTANL